MNDILIKYLDYKNLEKTVDNEGKKFRIKGKCDAIIKFIDGKSGIIDFKTSKFKKDERKN
jgi:hypothetical protein